jgi:SHAQKYF class myb-like DNA-binding protein
MARWRDLQVRQERERLSKRKHQDGEEQGGEGAKKTKKKASGRWTVQEHDQFLRALELHGKQWAEMVAMVPTRTSVQIQTHAQKHFAKMG